LSFSHADLTREVARAVEMCEMAARGEGKHIDFEVLTPAPPVYCRVDTQRVRQAVTNLVRNAVEVSRDGGRVTVRLQTGGCADGGSSGADQSKDYLSIKVMDDGEGVPPDLTEKIFTPFFTTKRGGTGLGLHNVRTIAGLHGGKVEYSLRASGGSTFTMTIPRW
jgi:signal transduction histidine kinase